MKTITFDEAIYKLAPVEPTPEIHQAGQDSGKNCAFSYSNCYRAMLLAVPDNLPGVVAHSGEPFAWHVGHGNDELDFLNYYEAEAIAQASKSGGIVSPLFAHPPAQPDTAQAICYPECWDVAAYPTLESALMAIGAFRCTECSPDTAGLNATLKALREKIMDRNRTVQFFKDECAAANARIAELEATVGNAKLIISNLKDQLAAQAGQEPFAQYICPCGLSASCTGDGDACIDPRMGAIAPANPLAIVQATLEAAAKVCEIDHPHTFARSVGSSIHAINPQTILDGMPK